VSGNYGIYANGNVQLVILDVDDYYDFEYNSGLKALLNLSSTFEQRIPTRRDAQALKSGANRRR